MHDAYYKNVLKVAYTKFLIDCKMFVKGSVPNIEKMKLPNVSQKSNDHIYLHKSTKFSAPITKLIISFAVTIVTVACLLNTLLFFQC